jgi:hypothetical protein
MSEQTSNPTSGQNVPKSKFRRKSRQEQTAASKLRMERRGEKLDAAREKLAKQKPPKKPGAVKRLAHTAGHGVHSFVHGKLYEVEHENVGTEGAHRSELAAESVYRFGRRKLRKAIREHPAKAVERAESKHIKATADYYYRKTVEEHPEMQEGGAVSRYLQKQKIKRQYAKQAREAARQTAKAAEGTASVTGKLTEKVSAYIKEHPGGLLLLLAAFLLLVVLQSCMSSLVTVGNGVAGAIGASTYAAEDTDLLGAEAAYCALEDELQRYLDTYTRTHDYDEYHFDLDTIEHDPYVLISMISALHEGAWTLDEVRGTLQTLFDRQYILTEDVVVRCATVPLPGRTARATTMMLKFRTTITSAMSRWKTSISPICPFTSWARKPCPGTPSTWRRWATVPTCSRPRPMWASTPASPRCMRSRRTTLPMKPLPPF